MSSTLQTIVLLAAAVAGIVVISKFALAVSKFITKVDEKVLPNADYMPNLAKLDPLMSVVEEIAAQFRSDSGSTLKDTTNRLEQALELLTEAVLANKMAAEEFARINREGIAAVEVAMRTVRELAKEDRLLAREDRDRARDAYEKLLALVESGVLADESRARTEASGARIEAAGAVVAEDLAATQKRADKVEDHEPPGSAADAASQSPE